MKGSDIGRIAGWSPAAVDAEQVAIVVEAVDGALADDLAGGRVRHGTGHEAQVMDMAGGNGVQGEALSQVLGMIELPVLDPGAGLEDGEPGLEWPIGSGTSERSAARVRRLARP